MISLGYIVSYTSIVSTYAYERKINKHKTYIIVDFYTDYVTNTSYLSRHKPQ
jgi:hypothetical protein